MKLKDYFWCLVDADGRPTILGQFKVEFQVVEVAYMGFAELFIAESHAGQHIFNFKRDQNLLVQE